MSRGVEVRGEGSLCLLELERRQSEEDGLADEYKKPRSLF